MPPYYDRLFLKIPIFFSLFACTGIIQNVIKMHWCILNDPVYMVCGKPIMFLGNDRRFKKERNNVGLFC